MKTQSLLSSMMTQSCPACRKEKMFKSPMYSLHFNEMHSHCPNCHQSFDPEPGFYTGAMYVSYGFQVAIMVTSFLMIQLFAPDAPIGLYLGVVIGTVLSLFPLIFRLSRSIWIHLMVNYRSGLSSPGISHKNSIS